MGDFAFTELSEVFPNVFVDFLSSAFFSGVADRASEERLVHGGYVFRNIDDYAANDATVLSGCRNGIG